MWPPGLIECVVVSEFRLGDAHVEQDALQRIDRTGGDGDHGDVALGVVGGHVEGETGERAGGHGLSELAAPFAGLDDNGVGGVDRDVGDAEGAVGRGIGETDHTGRDRRW